MSKTPPGDIANTRFLERSKRERDKKKKEPKPKPKPTRAKNDKSSTDLRLVKTTVTSRK